MTQLDLAALTAPLDADEFLSAFWEQKPFVSRNGPTDRFAGLFDLAAMDDTLTHSNIAAPFIRLARQGKVVPVADLRGQGPFGHVGVLDRLYEEYRNGATIILQAMQDRHLPLRLFCQRMAQTFSAAFQVNVYLTPPGEQGFSTHYDTHDVFVLQLHGSKRWRLYGDPVWLPSPQEPPSLNTAGPGKIVEEFDLHPGQMIYLPRGWWHDAAATDQTSLHLTVGTFPLTWGALAMHAVERAVAQNPDFRRALPPGFAGSPQAVSSAQTQWAALLTGLVKDLNDSDDLTRAARAARSGRQPSLERHLQDLAGAPDLDLDTDLRMRPGLDVAIARGADTVHLAFNGKEMTFPAHVAPTLDGISADQTTTARHMAGDIDDDARLLLARRLVEEGFLTLQA